MREGRKRKGGKEIAEAFKRWGYSEREVADYLRLHYSTLSRLIKREAESETSKYKTCPPNFSPIPEC
jgi:IS30 family transposase